MSHEDREMIQFSLQPQEAELQQLADNYWESMSDKYQAEEKDAFDAGAPIRGGDRTPSTLRKIVHWKSPRIVPHFDKNSPEAVKSALDVAVSHTSEAEALAALVILQGVAVPVASAMLTAIYPERYTVLDFRALEALGYFPQDERFYIAYLDFCRNLATVMKPQESLPAPTKLRALDRALWQWSKNEAKNR